MRKFILVLLLNLAALPVFAKEIYHLSSYKTKYETDLSIKLKSDELKTVNKDYLNAFLVAKRKIELAANLRPFDAAIILDEKLNAFMFDNGLRGNLAITTGALNEIKDNVSLYAALVGHEAGHYINQHRMKRSERSRGATLFAAFLLGASAGRSSIYLPHESAEQLGTFLAGPFSREDEHEADLEGLRLVIKAGFGHEPVLQLLELLLKKERNHSFFSTHPHPEERISRIKSIELPPTVE